jgi:hypothetical protein
MSNIFSPTIRKSRFVRGQTDLIAFPEAIVDRFQLTIVGSAYTLLLFDGLRSLVALIILILLEPIRWRSSQLYSVSRDDQGPLNFFRFGRVMTLLLFSSLFAAAGSFTYFGVFFSKSTELMNALSQIANLVLSICDGGIIDQDLRGLAGFDLQHRNVALSANVLWSITGLSGEIFVFFSGGLFVATFRRQLSNALQRLRRRRNQTLAARLFLYGSLVLINWMLIYELVANIPHEITLYDGLAYVIATLAEVAGAMAGPTILAYGFLSYRIMTKHLA